MGRLVWGYYYIIPPNQPTSPSQNNQPRPTSQPTSTESTTLSTDGSFTPRAKPGRIFADRVGIFGEMTIFAVHMIFKAVPMA